MRRFFLINRDRILVFFFLSSTAAHNTARCVCSRVYVILPESNPHQLGTYTYLSEKYDETIVAVVWPTAIPSWKNKKQKCPPRPVNLLLQQLRGCRGVPSDNRKPIWSLKNRVGFKLWRKLNVPRRVKVTVTMWKSQVARR